MTSTPIVSASYPSVVDVVLLVSHVFLGTMIFAHGFRKVFRGGKLEGTAKWFDSIGMKPGKLHAYAAASTELCAGALLTLGLFTPLAAAGLLSVMLVAIVSIHRTNGFMITNPGGGIEYCLCLAVYSLTVGTLGGGRYALDHVWGVFSHWTPTTDFFATLIVGVGGALVQLSAFYRPPKRD